MIKKGKIMKLSQYLAKYEMTKARLCKEANILPQTLYALYKGQGLQLRTAVHIEKATRGMVTCRDLYLEFMKTPRKKYTKKKVPIAVTNLDVIEEKRRQKAQTAFNNAPHGLTYQNTDSTL